MEPVSKIVGALSEIRERAQEDKKMASKPGDKPETTVLDQGDSKRAPNLSNRDKPDKNLTDNSDKDSDWPRLIPIDSHC